MQEEIPQAVDNTGDNPIYQGLTQEETAPAPETPEIEGTSDATTPSDEAIATKPPGMPKRVLVTGSRSWPDKAAIANALLQWWLNNDRPLSVLVSGGARGADQMAEEVWNKQQFQVEHHPADWNHYGKRAGLIRNVEMVRAGADVCIAFIHNGSAGASHCARLAHEHGIPVILYRIDDSEDALDSALLGRGTPF